VERCEDYLRTPRNGNAAEAQPMTAKQFFSK
jgi:hypothetical protein